VFVPGEIFRKFGYWCEDYGQYGWEDSDYGIRLMLGGCATYFAPYTDGFLHLGAEDPAAFVDYMAFKLRKFATLERSAGEHVLAYMLGIRPLNMRRRYRTEYLDSLRARLVPDDDYVRREEAAMKRFRELLRREGIEVGFPHGEKDAMLLREQYHRLKTLISNGVPCN
jgi:hypothetical protein